MRIFLFSLGSINNCFFAGLMALNTWFDSQQQQCCWESAQKRENRYLLEISWNSVFNPSKFGLGWVNCERNPYSASHRVEFEVGRILKSPAFCEGRQLLPLLGWNISLASHFSQYLCVTVPSVSKEQTAWMVLKYQWYLSTIASGAILLL